jgi:hypothetical protein
MFKYVVTLEVTVNQADLEIKVYPVIEWRTSTKDKRIVEHAAVHRYIRDNWGSVTDVKAVRVSVEKIREVA